MLLAGCLPLNLDVDADLFGEVEGSGESSPDTETPAPGEVEVVAQATQVQGSQVLFELWSEQLEGWQALEVVWMLEEDGLEVLFEGGRASFVLPLHDPCTHIPLGGLQGVIRAAGWDTVFELALDGDVVALPVLESVIVDTRPVVLCGEDDRVDLWVVEAQSFAFDRRGDANIIVRAGQSSANLPTAMNLPAGDVWLDVVDHQGPFVLVLAPLELR